jgi:hypothetical protein
MPYFDPSGRFIAYLRQRPPGAPTTVSEHTVIHEVATGQDRMWKEPHTHVTGWMPDGLSIVGWQHATGGQNMVICRVADEACRVVTRGATPRPSPLGDRLYFTRPASTGGTYDLLSIGIDGTGERRETDLGAMRSIEVFFDVSRTGRVAWARLSALAPQVWTASLK